MSELTINIKHDDNYILFDKHNEDFSNYLNRLKMFGYELSSNYIDSYNIHANHKYIDLLKTYLYNNILFAIENIEYDENNMTIEELKDQQIIFIDVLNE